MTASSTHPPKAGSPVWTGALALAAVGVAAHLWLIHSYAPVAQLAAGGLAQKIFYFHVPAAYGMYIGALVCCVSSAAYLVRATHARNAWARSGAEVAVMFGLMVMSSGPLWAKKAWGVYWTWDPRLTSVILTVLLYVALVVLRQFTGDGAAERRFAAAFGVLAATLIPIIHYSVRLWGGNHPTVITKGGGGISSDMRTVLLMGFGTMTLLAIILIISRAKIALAESRLSDAEELAAAVGLIEGDDYDYPDEDES